MKGLKKMGGQCYVNFKPNIIASDISRKTMSQILGQGKTMSQFSVVK